MKTFQILSCLFVVSLSVVHFKTRSSNGDYELKLKSIKSFDDLINRIPSLKSKCTLPTSGMSSFCEKISTKESMQLLQEEDLVLFIDRMETIKTKTTVTHRNNKRAVPWNLDRLNQRKGLLDNSYHDDAQVDVYILGNGLRVDHVEFGSRASLGWSDFGDDSDCDGTGTVLASLVGGQTTGRARAASLIGVKVVNCEGNTSPAAVMRGIEYIEENIRKNSDRRALVLVGFTTDSVQRGINDKLVGLSDLRYGAYSGVLVVGGAGESGDYNSCGTTPASAQGDTALDGVVTLGAADREDNTISNLGECVDLFAPGENILAAGNTAPTSLTVCTGSVCAAALAAGVIAEALRENSKIDLEMQKAMLINGATNIQLTLPPDDDFGIKILKSQTPMKLLYSNCGYYRSESPPTCESYTADCSNSKVSSFDGNSVPLYQQTVKKCGFHVFNSPDNGVSVEGSYYDCSLAAYSVQWNDNKILLLPGPQAVLNQRSMLREEIQFSSDDLSVEHVVDLAASPREPLVVLTLKRNGRDEIQLTYDCTSRLTVTLLDYSRYSGNTGGLCGLYDNDGTNDYKLADGTQLPAYSTSFHASWLVHQDEECRECEGGGCDCEDGGCADSARAFCQDKFKGAPAECFDDKSDYNELQSCIKEVSKCCCQAKKGGDANPDLQKSCCQNSYFGNFERNKEGCNFCDKPQCEKEPTHKKCIDHSTKEYFDYMESIEYDPIDCCHYVPEHDSVTCTAPRNGDMMWDKGVPECQIKTCSRPEVPNNQTLLTPDKAMYYCGDTVTVTCDTCHQINPEPQIIRCNGGEDLRSNDGEWSEPVDTCKMITCPEPALPHIDNDKGVLYPLSWISRPVPHGTNCGDNIEFECDACYDMFPENENSISCVENGRWTDSPRCKLRYCDNPRSPPLDYPLSIKTDNRACNDTIQYECRTSDGDKAGDACYDLEGDELSSCKVDGDRIGWDTVRPSCKIRTCPQLKLGDLLGDGTGLYKYWDDAASTYQDIWLTDTGSNSPEECGATVSVVCDECSYLCGAEDSRVCKPDGKWSEAPICAKRLCRAPANDEDISHALYNPLNPRTKACGSRITYWCKSDCYEYDSGDEEHECVPDIPEEVPEDQRHRVASARWDGQPYQCKIKECGAIAAPQNGRIVAGEGEVTCGSAVRFECNDCYEMEGEATIRCGSDKQWSSEPPKCVKKKCGSPGNPLHGSGSTSSWYDCGEQLEFSCDSCYYLEGEATTRCTNERSWTNPVPQCTMYECARRDNPLHGYISNSNFYQCGDEVTYSCETCYEKSGPDGAECLHGGAWSEDEPSCNLRTCPAPAVPSNTLVSPLQSLYHCGDYITVKCDSCYQLEAPVDIHCTETGWERPVPGCGIKKCPNPPPLDRLNKTLDYGEGLFRKGQYTSAIALKEDGEEVDSLESEEHLIEAPEGLGFKTPYTTDTTHECGKEVQYVCDECYNLRGDKVITCNVDKKWTAEDMPVCEQKLCTEPEALTEHLQTDKEDQSIYSCKEPVLYSCDDKCWELVGLKERVCRPEEGSELGVWYPAKPPVCERKLCFPPLLFDDLVTVTGNYQCGNTITFTCPPCYRLEGAGSATCLHTEEWSAAPPTCVPDCCSPLPDSPSYDVTYDVITMSYNYTHQGDQRQRGACGVNHVCQTAETACQECYEYVSKTGETLGLAPRRDCLSNGTWTNTGEVCTRKSCDVRTPERDTQHIRYVETDMSDKVNCGDKVQFECEACYENHEDSMSHECLPSKSWSAPVPTCALKECADLPSVNPNCRFPGESQTCGSQRGLECSDCYYFNSGGGGQCTDATVRCNIRKEWEWMTATPSVQSKTCDAPPDVDHASFVRNGLDYSCGRLVRYECDECYEMEEPGDCNCAELTCVGSTDTGDCRKGSWSGALPACNPVTCPELDVPDHAHVVTRRSGCLQVTEFACDEGYELRDGDLNRTCNTNKEWTGSLPVCEIRLCTPLSAPEDGSISSTAHHYGTVVTFSCNVCFKIPDSMTDPGKLLVESVYPRYHILKCEAHGNWNGSEPVCQRRYCGKPSVPGNGDFADKSDISFYCGDQVSFSCDQGYYEASGDNVRECLPDSSWDGQELVCDVKTCTTPAKVSHADFSPETGTYTYKYSVEYDCDYCYESEDLTRLTCEDPHRDGAVTDSHGFWEPVTLPECTRKQCAGVSPGDNARLVKIYDDLNTTDCGQVVEVQCDAGYFINGHTKSMFCGSSGEWSMDVPECEKRCCSRRDRVDRGKITSLSDGQCFGDKIRVECDSCYELYMEEKPAPDPFRVQECLADGSWDEELPVCRRIRCPSVTVENGRHQDSGFAMRCSSERTFTCNPGFRLVGTPKLQCQENGAWSADPPTCAPIPCSAADIRVEHGRFRLWPYEEVPTGGPTPVMPESEDWYALYQQVVFECDEGYDLDGREDAICTETGAWSGAPPRCVKDLCEELPQPEHGQVFVDKYSQGGLATFSCDRCYTIQVTNTLVCDSGKWLLSKMPYCEENVCYPPGTAEDSFILAFNLTRLTYSCGDVVEYACNSTHKLIGPKTRVCGEDGRWSDREPVCANTECPEIDHLENGGVKSLNVNGSDNLEFWCDKGYQLAGDSALLCVKGQWQGVQPSCSKQICGDPGEPDFGLREGGSFEYGDSVRFYCSEGYQLRGARTITCTHKGLWDNRPPYCVCNECPRLPLPTHGHIISTDANIYLSRIEYICEPGYEVVGNATRTCEASGRWSGGTATCEKLSCTEDYEVPAGAEVVLKEGVRFEDSLSIKCQNKMGGWTRTCTAQGVWSGTLPPSCDCIKSTRKKKVQRTVIEPAECHFGICTEETTRTITVVEDEEFYDCSQ